MVRIWLIHFYIVQYDIYVYMCMYVYVCVCVYIYIQQKLLMLRLSVHASIHVALYVQFSSVYHRSKWIGSLYL